MTHFFESASQNKFLRVSKNGLSWQRPDLTKTSYRGQEIHRHVMNLSHSRTHSNSPIPHTHTHKPESDACTYAHTRAYTLCMQSETPMLVCTLHTFTLSLPVFETRTRQHSTSVSVLVSFYISCI